MLLAEKRNRKKQNKIESLSIEIQFKISNHKKINLNELKSFNAMPIQNIENNSF